MHARRPWGCFDLIKEPAAYKWEKLLQGGAYFFCEEESKYALINAKKRLSKLWLLLTAQDGKSKEVRENRRGDL